MKIISAITTFFSHSNYGKKQLKDKLKHEEDRRGLVSFGATRFSTFADQSSSVTRCLPAMEKCYSEGLIKFDTKAVSDIHTSESLDLPNSQDKTTPAIFCGQLSRPTQFPSSTLQHQYASQTDFPRSQDIGKYAGDLFRCVYHLDWHCHWI